MKTHRSTTFSLLRCLHGILIILLAISTVTSAANYADSGWAHQQKIYLNTSSSGANVSGTVTNFPILIRLTVMNFVFSQAQTVGQDIRFTNASGIILPYEIERWTDSAADIWVKVDSVKGNNNTQYITMFWGKSSAVTAARSTVVFDTTDGYSAVWHLNEAGNGTAGEFKDATVNANNGRGGGGQSTYLPQLSTGIIGNCQHFDTVGNAQDHINCGGSSTINGNFTSMTMSAWFKLDQPGTGNFLFGNGGGWGMTGYFLSNVVPTIDAATIYDLMAIVDKNWHNVIVSWPGDSTYIYIYIDGVKYTKSFPKNVTGTGGVEFGIGSFTTGGYMNSANTRGYIDEVRVMKKAMSDDWAKLCYENQKTDQQFVNIPIDAPWIATSVGSIVHILANQSPLSQISPDTIDIWNNGTQGTVSYTATIKHNSSWLSVVPTSGSSTGTSNRAKLVLSYNVSSLSSGYWMDTIVVSDPQSLNGAVYIPVKIGVGTEGIIMFSPTSIVHTVVGEFPEYTPLAPDSIEIWNGEPLYPFNYSVFIKNHSPCFILLDTAGSASATHHKFAVEYDLSNYYGGTMIDTIVITSQGLSNAGAKYIPVTLTDIPVGVFSHPNNQKPQKITWTLHRGKFTLSYKGSISAAMHPTLSIYDARGRVVGQASMIASTPLGVQAIWNGLDKSGNKVKNGVYFARLSAQTGAGTKQTLCSIKLNYLQ